MPLITGSHTGSPAQPSLYVCGTPGKIGGAGTKILHLLRLLEGQFRLTVIAPEVSVSKNKNVRQLLEPQGIPCLTIKDLPSKLDGVALGICSRDFFASGRAQALKARGLKIVWSNEMMFPLPGEAEAARAGVIDRVLFVSSSQAETFAEMYSGVTSFQTGNYVDPDGYCWRSRSNGTYALGRLSRPDPLKYPVDFPVFYEEIGLREVKYRIMAWSPELQRQYRWHRFGPEWEFLPANKQSALSFLYSLDVFLYPLGHRIRESWGRAVVEAMLTGCVPVVPAGHQFHNLMVHGESGFICKGFREFKSCVRELYENYPLRLRISRQAADFAREHLCNPEKHRKIWIEALTF